jgi:polyether ionophore transport system ATP-binding protein
MPEPAIRTEGLTKHFGDVVALDGLTLEVQQGEIFGFLGPNGAGKSTTIRLLLNLIRPTAGAAWIMGTPAGDVAQAHRHVTYVPGDVSLWPQLTGVETLELLGNISGQVDVPFRDEVIERLQLDPSKRVRAYSKGNRQKIALVAAFMTRPDVLLLDEPTAGLDPLMEEEFQELARDASARGQTIFLSSHILDEVEDLCHRVAILREGRLIEVATLDQLQELDTTVFAIDFEDDGVLPDFMTVDGVISAEVDARQARVTVKGSPAPLLHVLSTLPVRQLRTHTPSLEEIFLSYY